MICHRSLKTMTSFCITLKSEYFAETGYQLVGQEYGKVICSDKAFVERKGVVIIWE
jgi:hypothetical protein